MGYSNGVVTLSCQCLSIPSVKQNILFYVGEPNMTEEISNVYENPRRKPQALLGVGEDLTGPPSWVCGLSQGAFSKTAARVSTKSVCCYPGTGAWGHLRFGPELTVCRKGRGVGPGE